MTKPDLKPCPFCGDFARVRHASGRWWVICVGCQAGTFDFDSPDLAIAAWNRRTDKEG